MISQDVQRAYIMKKTLVLIKSLASSNSEINDLLESYEKNRIDEDTLISSAILILSAEKSNADEKDDDIKLDLMTW